jgi:hypothetical protein
MNPVLECLLELEELSSALATWYTESNYLCHCHYYDTGSAARRVEETAEIRGLCSSCCSLNTIRLIKRRRMRWAGHVTCTGRWEMHTKFWFVRVNRSLGNVATDNMIIFK